MRTIHKYQLEVTDTCVIDMPKFAKILTVQVQKQLPCLWCLVDTEMEMGKRIISTRGTGRDIDEICAYPYIGSYQLLEGTLVFHVFDQGYK